jgi:hypothetical protein
MRVTRTILALGVLVIAALFAVWPASGQQTTPAPLVEVPQLANHQLAYGMLGGRPRDKELAKLIDAEVSAQREVSRLTTEYGRTEGNEARTKVKDKLSAALVKQFDAQQKRRELELSRVEAQVKKLRELMKKRDEERKTIIEKRLDQLVREADGLGWAPPPAVSAPNGAQYPHLRNQ